MMKKKLFLGIALILITEMAFAADESFNITLTLLEPIVITETHALTFPDQPQGVAQTITVLTGDAEAATFTATGSPNKSVTRSVVEANVQITNSTDNITVNNFQVAGAAAFDGTGNINNFAVGADAVIIGSESAGNYVGSATFRVVYQ